MSNGDTIIFFDLPSREPCKTWSLNPWKTRLFLNYKNIPYKTQWTQYADIPAILSPHVPPHPDGTAIKPYTIPAVLLPDGTYIQESLSIAEKLSELYPTPELKVHTPALEEVIERIKRILPGAGADYLDRIPKRILNAKDEEFWYPDREKMVGMPVSELQAKKGGKAVSEAIAEDIKAIGTLLKKNGGPFFEGQQVTYVDFVWGALLLFFERIGQDVFDIVIHEDKEVHVKLLEEIKKKGWTQRDDH